MVSLYAEIDTIIWQAYSFATVTNEHASLQQIFGTREIKAIDGSNDSGLPEIQTNHYTDYSTDLGISASTSNQIGTCYPSPCTAQERNSIYIAVVNSPNANLAYYASGFEVGTSSDGRLFVNFYIDTGMTVQNSYPTTSFCCNPSNPVNLTLSSQVTDMEWAMASSKDYTSTSFSSNAGDHDGTQGLPVYDNSTYDKLEVVQLIDPGALANSDTGPY
jgi:hypothetical protein